MSRRFGRNQRRRARQELEAKAQELQLANDHIQGQDRRLATQSASMAQMRRQIEALQAVADGVKKALGRKSVLFEPVIGMTLEHYLPVVQLFDALGMADEFKPTDKPHLDKITTTTYAILDCELEDQHWARKQHFYVRVKDEKMVGYAFDESMLRMQAGRGAFIHNVAKMVARSLEGLIEDGQLKVA